MQIEELQGPSFALNENGKVAIFIPEIKGDPEKPSLSYLGKNALMFNRSEKTGCRMTYVTDEAMERVGKSEKCLIIELDMAKVTDLYAKDESDLESAFTKIYEADVDGDSFAKKGEK